MAYGSVNVPMRSDFLPLTGGTVDGELTVTGTITGSLNGNASTATNATKWNGKVLRQKHNTTDTWIPVFSGNYVDYVLKSEITQDLDNRIRDCEAKYMAIAKTTEELLRSLAFNVSGQTLVDNKLSYNFATMNSDVAFIRFSSGNSASKLLRGSSTYVLMDVYSYNSGDNYWTTIPLRCTFHQNGVLSVTDEDQNLYLNMYDARTSKFSGTIYQYKYLA